MTKQKSSEDSDISNTQDISSGNAEILASIACGKSREEAGVVDHLFNNCYQCPGYSLFVFLTDTLSLMWVTKVKEDWVSLGRQR